MRALPAISRSGCPVSRGSCHSVLLYPCCPVETFALCPLSCESFRYYPIYLIILCKLSIRELILWKLSARERGSYLHEVEVCPGWTVKAPGRYRKQGHIRLPISSIFWELLL
jgi:hypothetical protein